MKLVLDDSIGYLLHRTNMRAKNELLQALRPLDLTPEQWAVLNRLWEKDGIPQKELAARISKDQPTVARILKKVQNKGLINRRADSVDKRVTLVFLTDKGRELEGKMVSLVQRVLGKALKDFSQKEVQLLRTMLNRIYHNLQ